MPPQPAAQDYPPAFPRPNATRLLENEQITVWDIVWPEGQPSPLHRHVYDQVGTYYQAGGRVITSLDGTKRNAMTAVGALSTTRRGTTHIEEGASDPPLRAVFIELKQDGPSGPAAPASGVPSRVSPRRRQGAARRRARDGLGLLVDVRLTGDPVAVRARHDLGLARFRNVSCHQAGQARPRPCR